VEWSASPIEPATHQEFFDEVFLAGGAIGSSLQRLVELMENLPFAAEPLEGLTADDQPISGFRVTFDAADIDDYFRTTGLELVGPFPASGSTIYDVWIDNTIVRIVGAGTQFHDGEALPDTLVVIDYTVLDEVSIESPLPAASG